MKKNTFTVAGVISILLIFLAFNSAFAQERIAVIQNPFVVLLDPVDGSIIDPDFIDLTELNPSTPKSILQVGDEIWITDQLEDRIDRFDLEGAYISAISGGLDNIRGAENVNGEVWVANAGSNNGAPGNAIVRFSTTGDNLGFIPTTGSDSVFDIIDVGNNEVYLSYISNESKIERRDYDGNVLGNIVEEGVVNFIQQMELNPTNNSVYAAVFSSSGSNLSGLYEFEIATGAILNYYSEGSLRGVSTLDNGDVLVSSAAGVSIIDPVTGSSTVVNGDSSQFFARLSLEVLEVTDINKEKLVMYPNPARNQLFIESGFIMDEIQVFSMTGKKVVQTTVNDYNRTIDVSILPNGIYILSVTSNGSVRHHKFLIAQ